MIITIDGPSGTGKSTISKKIAEALGFSFFDTGAMYRSITWLILEKKIDINNPEELGKILQEFDFIIQEDEREKRYFVGDVEVTKEIRSSKITSYVSEVAAIPEIRKKLVTIQREYAKKQNAVFEGRDMGTVVFPDADMKFFLNASAEVRAKRRFKELVEKFPEQEFHEETILEEIKKRDDYDSSRKVSPLRKTGDMIEVDTSHKTIEEVTAEMLAKLSKRTRKMGFFYRFILTIAGALFKLFYRLEVRGKEHFLPGPAIIAANHVSYLDPPIVAVSSPEEVHFLARSTLFKNKLFGPFIRKLNAHPVAKGAKDAVIIKEILRQLSKGNKVLLFPEGARSYDGKLQPLEKGLGFLAYKSKAMIIPAYVEGVYKLWPRERKFPKLFGKVRCSFGAPIRPSDQLDRESYMSEVLKQTEEALRQLEKES